MVMLFEGSLQRGLWLGNSAFISKDLSCLVDMWLRGFFFRVLRLCTGVRLLSLFLLVCC